MKQSLTISKEKIYEEILKCGKDPVYFINNYCKLSHPIHGLIPFALYDFQEQLIHDFQDHRYNIILKARQLGISWVTAAYAAWLMQFHREKNIMAIATKFATAQNIIRKVKHMLEHLPDWLKMAQIKVDNKASLELENGSKITASGTSTTAGRSEALSLLIIDEAAHVDGMDEIWTGLAPTLSTGGRCIALSSPLGRGNWFHEMFVGAESNLNEFYPTTLPWYVHPDRDKEWFEKETRSMSKRAVAQEHLCDFTHSGETVFDSEDLDYLKNHLQDPKRRTGFDRNLWIWKDYDPSESYVICADVARGDGTDFSTFQVVEIRTGIQAAEYQSKAPIEMFAKVLFDTGKEYGSAMVVIENNTVGYALLQKMIDLSYPNIYYSQKGTHNFMDADIAENSNSAVPGFSMTVKTRPWVVSKCEELVRNKVMKINSKRLYHEMTTFIWHNGKPQAVVRKIKNFDATEENTDNTKSYNDDLVMAFAIACWIKDTVFTVNQREVEYRKAMLGAIRTSRTVFNSSIPGQMEHKPIKIEEEVTAARKFAWLMKG